MPAVTIGDGFAAVNRGRAGSVNRAHGLQGLVVGRLGVVGRRSRFVHAKDPPNINFGLP